MLSLGTDSAQEKIEGMQELYIKSGVKEAAEEEIANYHKKALEIINTLNLTEAQKEQLYEYANMLIKRNK